MSVLLFDRFADLSNWHFANGNMFSGGPGTFVSGSGVTSLNTQRLITNDGRMVQRPGGLSMNAINYGGGVPGTWHGPQIQTNLQYQYGLFEARMRLPPGQGSWPAFWLNNGTPGPVTAEIDIMEAINACNVLHMTIHSWVANDHWQLGDYVNMTPGWHVFGADWRENRIEFFLDGVSVSVMTPARTHLNEWPLNVPMNVILNLSIGGSWAGNPNSTTPPRLTADVDWVRITS